MVRRMLERLRGVRHIEWLALIMILAAVVLTAGGAESGGTEATALERRMESVLSCVAGAGRVRVLVNEGDRADAPSGVLVVAEGAGDVRVRLELQQAVQALLGVETAQIEVLVMKEDEV